MTSQEILEARQELGLNIKTMARCLGVHRDTYGKWERGEQRITAGPASAVEMLLYMQLCGVIQGWLDR